MNKKQLLENLHKNTYCRLAPSKISGVGVFAIRDIPKGTDPFEGSIEQKFIPISDKEIEHIPEEVKEMVHHFFIRRNGKYLVAENGLNSMDIGYYMNHSEIPNIVTDEMGEVSYAIRDIKKGEELTFDYDKSYGEGNNP